MQLLHYGKWTKFYVGNGTTFLAKGHQPRPKIADEPLGIDYTYIKGIPHLIGIVYVSHLTHGLQQKSWIKTLGQIINTKQVVYWSPSTL